ncbi:MAG: hypothetical protein M1827_007136 [Pycnora praestabilis]|nr:MAG: hypothetical protein M1827_007136 [Pycnora praestabilis]
MSCCTSCCPGGGRGHKHQKLDQGNQYQPAPYQGYQPAQAPPRYEPPRYAQFDISRGGKVSDDSLPAMPVWDSASQRKVFDERQDDDMELGNFDAAAAQNVSMLAKPTSSPTHGYAEADSNPIYSYQDWGREGGGDLGVSYPYGHPIGTYGGAYAQSPPPNNPSPGGYGGGQNPYTAFSPTGVNTTYDQPAYRQGSLVPQYPAQSQSQPLVAVRKPVQGSWREI